MCLYMFRLDTLMGSFGFHVSKCYLLSGLELQGAVAVLSMRENGSCASHS